ncbi:MAG: energy-coupling factor transporter transmembrane component T [Thermodesulfovibrionia bacterium]|nr:energy-coupling factor transporter transmembrane component T [Thermodesulfovibrionia bacterium]
MIKFSPAAKIFLYILLIITVFLTNSFKVYLGILILVSFFAFSLPVSVLTRGLVPITLFILFIFISNALFQTGRVVYEIFGFTLTEDGIKNGGHLALRLFILIFGAKILTAITTTDDLVRGMTSLLGPIGRWSPVKDFVSTMSLSIRFLPIIYDEAQTFYRDTFKNSTEKTFLDKIRLSASLLSTLFERSVKRARDLSD